MMPFRSAVLIISHCDKGATI